MTIPSFLDSRKLLWDDVLQKIEAKKENLEEKEEWEKTEVGSVEEADWDSPPPL